MTGAHLLIPVLLPAIAGLAALLLTGRRQRLCGPLTVLVTAANLLAVILLFGQRLALTAGWGGFGMDFALRLDRFASFILLAAAGFGLLLGIYSIAFMAGRRAVGQYFAYFLLTLGMVNGAVLADNLVVLLFFWEGLLLTLFGMIWIGHAGAFRTAIKAFVITGVADLCMMAGVALVGHAAGSLTMSRIPPIALNGTAPVAAFLLLMVGATAKAGAMPFHSWIPDAAIDAPAPFMAFVPAALEKLLGIYFLGRLVLELFALRPSSWLSPLLMVIGCVTIVLAVLMALIQTDYKRLLSYHAISQVGYMILGIGTAVPVGIVGGLFHMVNHAMYKSCLFLTGGAVERQAGTCDLRRLGGLASSMPVTFGCFVVAAASICGVPPFNGFFSKELVYDGALARHWGYYAAALAGSFFTAASFLKLGHAAFKGRPAADRPPVREAPASMLAPMLVIAGLCILFGVYNPLPLRGLVQPVLGSRMAGHDFSGVPHAWGLVAATVVVLAAAAANHVWGVRRTGSGLQAADHIHYAPVLHGLYDHAEKRHFDPYDLGLQLVKAIGWVGWRIDRLIDFLCEFVIAGTVRILALLVRALHNGSHAAYLGWALAGFGCILWLLFEAG